MTSGKGKIALITNATSGIGREIAYIHAENGGSLILVSKNKTALDQFKKELEEAYDIPIYAIERDICQASSPKEIFSEIHKAGLKIDFLVNDAAFGELCKMYGHEKQHFMAMIDLHMVALAALTRLFLPELIKRNEGRILNVSSTALTIPCSMESIYFANKAFFSNLSTAFATELSDSKVTITNLMPLIKSSRFGMSPFEAKTPVFVRKFNARKVAKKGYKAMLDGKLNIICGVTVTQKSRYSIMPSIPKKAVLESVRKMQEIF
jgi:short-subunit dehydrogenase